MIFSLHIQSEAVYCLLCLSALSQRLTKKRAYRTEALTSCKQSTVPLEAQNHQTKLAQQPASREPLSHSKASHALVDHHRNDLPRPNHSLTRWDVLYRFSVKMFCSQRPTFWWLCALRQIQRVVAFVILTVFSAWRRGRKRGRQCQTTGGWKETPGLCWGWCQNLWTVGAENASQTTNNAQVFKCTHSTEMYKHSLQAKLLPFRKSFTSRFFLNK